MTIKCLFLLILQFTSGFPELPKEFKQLLRFILDKGSYLLPHDRNDEFPFYNFLPEFKKFLKPNESIEFESYCFKRIKIESYLNSDSKLILKIKTFGNILN